MATKRERAMENYNGHNGMATVAHVEGNVEKAYPKAWNDLTGAQYGKVMSVANQSFQDGRALAVKEMQENELIQIGGKCIPTALMDHITIEYYVMDDDYNREHGTTYKGTIVKFDGVEIARYPYML